MNRGPILGIAAAVGLAVAGYMAMDSAEAADAVDPAGTYGAVQVTAAPASPRCFPTAGLNSRGGVLVANLGPNTIYCGFNSSVTTATGMPIATNEKLAIGISYRKGTSAGQVQICCISTVLQVSPADTRYMEAR